MEGSTVFNTARSIYIYIHRFALLIYASTIGYTTWVSYMIHQCPVSWHHRAVRGCNCKIKAFKTTYFGTTLGKAQYTYSPIVIFPLQTCKVYKFNIQNWPKPWTLSRNGLVSTRHLEMYDPIYSLSITQYSRILPQISRSLAQTIHKDIRYATYITRVNVGAFGRGVV